MKRLKIFLKNIVMNIYRLTIDNTVLVDVLRKRGVSIGENCRIFSDSFGSEPYLVKIGNDVTISNNVQFITHDGGIHVLRKDFIPNEDLIGKIEIGNNCFIGANSIILPNVTIGDNVIIGAGSIVTKPIESNLVVAGVPARAIKTLDEYYKGIKTETISTHNLKKKEKERVIKDIFKC